MSNLLGEVISASERIETTPTEITNELSGSWSFFNFTPLGILNIILMLLILSILGINVLGYTEYVVNNYIEPVFKYFGYSLVSVTDATVKKSRKGTEYGIDKVVSTTKTALKDLDRILENDNDDAMNTSSIDDSNDDNAVNYEADESTSEIQRGRSSGLSKAKNGYCYIGTDRGVRSCVKISDHQKCMSGNVFPRMDICVNPKLRY